MYSATDRNAVNSRTSRTQIRSGQTPSNQSLGNQSLSGLSRSAPVSRATSSSSDERGLCTIAEVLPAVLARYGLAAECAEPATAIVFAPVETATRVLALSF